MNNGHCQNMHSLKAVIIIHNYTAHNPSFIICYCVQRGSRLMFLSTLLIEWLWIWQWMCLFLSCALISSPLFCHRSLGSCSLHRHARKSAQKDPIEGRDAGSVLDGWTLSITHFYFPVEANAVCCSSFLIHRLPHMVRKSPQRQDLSGVRNQAFKLLVARLHSSCRMQVLKWRKRPGSAWLS